MIIKCHDCSRYSRVFANQVVIDEMTAVTPFKDSGIWQKRKQNKSGILEKRYYTSIHNHVNVKLFIRIVPSLCIKNYVVLL